MATVPSLPLEMDDAGNKGYALPENHRLPGWTVDALLDQGKIVEAKAELERLVQEGVDSGPGIPCTPEFWEGLRAIARGATEPEG